MIHASRRRMKALSIGSLTGAWERAGLADEVGSDVIPGGEGR
jgi:hypothetical protein